MLLRISCCDWHTYDFPVMLLVFMLKGKLIIISSVMSDTPHLVPTSTAYNMAKVESVYHTIHHRFFVLRFF
jgi:hypothetical protein